MTPSAAAAGARPGALRRPWHLPSTTGGCRTTKGGWDRPLHLRAARAAPIAAGCAGIGGSVKARQRRTRRVDRADELGEGLQVAGQWARPLEVEAMTLTHTGAGAGAQRRPSRSPLDPPFPPCGFAVGFLQAQEVGRLTSPPLCASTHVGSCSRPRNDSLGRRPPPPSGRLPGTKSSAIGGFSSGVIVKSPIPLRRAYPRRRPRHK